MERTIERERPAWNLTEEWMQKEGIPIFEGAHGIEDITELPRRPWARMGGFGTFIVLEGTKQAGKLLYLAEIPAGGALEPEKHMCNELIYILRGRGLCEVWHEGEDKRTFEWGEGSLFAMPTNAWHRLANGGGEPALFFAFSNAPILIDAFRNTEFLFNCDYKFTDRYTGEADYFVAKDPSARWETNFVPDLRTAFLEGEHRKVADGRVTFITMASWWGVHSSEWPAGKYHKAHYHWPGAVLLGLKSEGYVLLWPRQYGIHPFQDGHGDKVIKLDWKPGSIYSPPNGWFHQHFNTGREPARHLAEKGGRSGFVGPEGQVEYRGNINVRDGGALIEYEDEDPEIRRMFEEALREKDIEYTMPPVVYRTDPFRFSF